MLCKVQMSALIPEAGVPTCGPLEAAPVPRSGPELGSDEESDAEGVKWWPVDSQGRGEGS